LSPTLNSLLTAAGGVLAGLALAVPLLLHRQRALRDLRRQARIDDLTGLPNRRALTVHLNHAQRSGRTYGLVLLDLDRFKMVNDHLGHQTGDDLLREVGGRLRLVAQFNPTIRCVARLGGDEFVMVVDGDLEDAAAAAHAARQEISAEPVQVHPDGYRLAVRASAGCAQSSPDLSPKQLLHLADQAMYESKRTGAVCAHTPGSDEPIEMAYRPNPRLRDSRAPWIPEPRGQRPSRHAATE
jgi:diguanylate cyclase